MSYSEKDNPNLDPCNSLHQEYYTEDGDFRHGLAVAGSLCGLFYIAVTGISIAFDSTLFEGIGWAGTIGSTAMSLMGTGQTITPTARNEAEQRVQRDYSGRRSYLEPK